MALKMLNSQSNSFPIVSVCIAMYNCSDTIERCAISLFTQTLKDIEYIFIDDGSDDDSMARLQELVKQYPLRANWITIKRHSKNLGISHTRLEAMSLASGKYLIHCDADDEVSSCMYQRLVESAEKNGSQLLYCDYIKVSKGVPESCQQPTVNSQRDFLHHIFMGTIHSGLWNKLVHRDIYSTVFLDCPDEIVMCEDMRILVQWTIKAQKIAHYPEGLYHYYVNQSSSTTSKRYYTPSGIRSRYLNLLFYDSLFLKTEYEKEREYLKQRLLLDAIFWGGVSNDEWHKLWKSEKRSFWRNPRFSRLLKFYFYCGCFSLTLSRFLKRMMSSKRHEEGFSYEAAR